MGTAPVQRTLCVFEAFLRSDIPGVDQMCDLALHELASLTTSPNHAVRTKATKVSHNSQPVVSVLVDLSPPLQIVHSLGFEGTEQSRGKQDEGSLLELAPPTGGGAASETHPQFSGGLLDGLTVVSNGQSLDPPPSIDGGLSSVFGNMAVEVGVVPGLPQDTCTNSHLSVQTLQPVVPPPAPPGDSLLDFSGEEDTELDPLKRTDSTASGFLTKSGNFNFERTGSNASGFLTKSGNFNFGVSEAAPSQQTVGPTHTVEGGFPTTAVTATTGGLCTVTLLCWACSGELRGVWPHET